MSQLGKFLLDVIDETHGILPAKMNFILVEFLTQINVPKPIIDSLYTISIPDFKFRMYERQYDLIQKESYQPLAFSSEDWILAYLAAENCWGVVSYDHHLLTDILQYLYYEVYWPQDIGNLPADSFILLDSNILLQFCTRNANIRHHVQQMFRKNNSVTFLLSTHIIDELKNVYTRKIAKINQKQKKTIIFKTMKGNTNMKINSEKKDWNPTEEELSQFIDDFENFQPKKQNRQKKQAKLNSQPRNKPNPRKSKWERILEKNF